MLYYEIVAENIIGGDSAVVLGGIERYPRKSLMVDLSAEYFMQRDHYLGENMFFAKHLKQLTTVKEFYNLEKGSDEH